MTKTPWKTLSEDGSTVTLELFRGDFSFPDYSDSTWLNDNSDEVRIGCSIDIETTGLDQDTDSIIEVGIQEFLFNKETGEVLATRRSYKGLQDPGRPLDPIITELTGITDSDLVNQVLDLKEIENILSSSHLLVAHNARFDRPFLDQISETSRSKVWGCSIEYIDWNANGFFSKTLELLSAYNGFFTHSHRALNDAQALLHLLTKSGKSGRPYFFEVISNARLARSIVFATNAPYDNRTLLKKRNYRWNPELRVWSKNLETRLCDAEVSWLEEHVYPGSFDGRVQPLSPFDAFSKHPVAERDS